MGADVTTSTITWQRPSDGLPDANARVLLWLRIDDSSDCYEGFYDGQQWYDSTGMPQDADTVVAWCDMPECPL